MIARGLRLVALIATFVCAALLMPGTVHAHAVLLASYPSDGSTVRGGGTVDLWFSEPVTIDPGAIEVLAPSGARVDRRPIANDGIHLSVPIAARVDGTYLVRWRVTSLDTHATAGQFTFSVGRASGVPGSEASGAALGLALQSLARWLHELGFALGFGSLACHLLVVQAPVAGAEAVARRQWRLLLAGTVLLLLAEPLAVLGQAAGLSLGTLVDPAAVRAALSSSFGRVAAQRVGAALGLWVLLGALKAGSGRAAYAVLGLGLVLALIDTESTHAVTTDPTWPAVTATVLHIVAAGIWAGGLAWIAYIGPSVDEASRARIAMRFGPVAAVCLALLGLTGVGMAVLHLRAPSSLVTTGYGRVLVLKTLIVLVAPACAFLAMTRYRLQRLRWWRLEALALLLVLGLAGVVVSLPPPA